METHGELLKSGTWALSNRMPHAPIMTGKLSRKAATKLLRNGSLTSCRANPAPLCSLEARLQSARGLSTKSRKHGMPRRGVLGIRIHNLKDRSGYTGTYGANPFDKLTLKSGTVKLSSVVKLYNPSGVSSTDIYKSIKDNIADWVEEAITIRDEY
jgi:hypothetical protein